MTASTGSTRSASSISIGGFAGASVCWTRASRSEGEPSVQPAVALDRKGDAVEGEDVVGPDDAGGGAHLRRVLEQTLHASLDPGIAGVPRDLQNALRGRGHESRAVEVNRRHHFSRIT